MNSKQECISKAYGEYWDKFKLLVDENGAISNKDFSFIDAEDIMEIFCYYHIGFNGETVGVEKWIPLSLAGIENNNGWIKIESEDSVPRDFENYHVVSKECGVIVGTACKNNKAVIKYWLEHFTHYQPITKPEPPLH